MKWIDKGWITSYLVTDDGEIVAEIQENMAGYYWTDVSTHKRYVDKQSAQSAIESKFIEF